MLNKVLISVAGVLLVAILVVGGIFLAKNNDETPKIVETSEPKESPSATPAPEPTEDAETATQAEEKPAPSPTPVETAPETSAPAPESSQPNTTPAQPAPVTPAPVEETPTPTPSPSLPPTDSKDQNAVLALVNSKRAENGLGALTINSKLTEAAAMQAQYQAAAMNMTHDGNGGLGARISSKGYAWCAAAENVAAGYTSADAVFTGWVNSPGHLANILSPNVTEMGLALSSGANGTIYWAQVFAKGC